MFTALAGTVVRETELTTPLTLGSVMRVASDKHTSRLPDNPYVSSSFYDNISLILEHGK
jgi:hypothetical protein